MKTKLENMKANSFITAKLLAKCSERYFFFPWNICSHQQTREESGTKFHLTVLENF